MSLDFTIRKNGNICEQQEALSAKGALALADKVPDDAMIIELSPDHAETADGVFTADLTPQC